MRIFVTGASGFVGSAVVRELVDAGHQVVGLARSDNAASAITAAGATAYRGDLTAPASLKRGAAEADAVIHTGFIHDFSRFKQNCELDREVIDVLGSALAGSPRPLIVTSAIGVLPSGQPRNDTAKAAPSSSNPRAATEDAVQALRERGVNASIIRLPPTVHGAGDHGFVPFLIQTAREKKASAVVGEGMNRWSAVHRRDAARLYRLALERGAPSATYHAIAEEGVPFREIAEAIGRGLMVPFVRKTLEEAVAHFGWMTHFAATDFTASSEATQAKLGWRSTGPSLLADLAEPHYFAEGSG